MYFNIIVTLNDIIFLLGCMPLAAIFIVMFGDWKKNRY